MAIEITVGEDVLQKGRPLGDFFLMERIGRGGEAEIWSALDHRHERVVALKIMANLNKDPAQLSYSSREFERQVHLIASLDHANILPLFDFGATSHYFYIAMRYTPLGTLDDLLSAGPLPLDSAVNFAAQIAIALDYLHRHNIIHRDLKPSNILMGPNQQLYLADFGLAKQLSQDTVPLHTGRGTGPYAPYEQNTHAQIMVQSDIYSYGVVIYQMLAGQLPWDGTSNLATQQLYEESELPDLNEIRPDLPDGLTAVLRNITAFEWQERPLTAKDAFQQIFYAANYGDANAFNRLYAANILLHEDLIEAEIAKEVWRNWQDRIQDPFLLDLTQFALLDFTCEKAEGTGFEITESLKKWMFLSAIKHGTNEEKWWAGIKDPQQLSLVLKRARADKDEAMLHRGINLLTQLPTTSAATFPTPILDILVELATDTTGTAVSKRAFEVLEKMVFDHTRWQEIGITANGDVQLAHLALSQHSQASRAAKLIGQSKSETAVHTIINQQNKIGTQPYLNTLEEIKQTAGSLPKLLTTTTRLQLWMRQAQRALLEDGSGLSWSRAGLGGLVGLIFTILMVWGVFGRIEDQMKDGLLTPYEVSNVVTIVEVNDESLAQYGRWGDWPRSIHANLINNLHDAGAKAIVFDFIFTSETEDDEALITAMQKAQNIVQPISGQGDALHTILGTLEYEQGILPNPELATSGTAIGHVNILHDPDGYVRRVPTTITIDNQQFPSLALQALHLFLGVNSPFPLLPHDDALSVLGREIPVGDHGEMSLYFAGPPAQPNATTFQTVSYQDVLNGVADEALFRDKIVVVGITATAEPDRYLTAVSRGRPMYGVEILANTIEAIWSNKFIEQPPLFWRIIVLFTLAVFTGLICTKPWSGLLLAGGTAVFYFILVSWLFDWQAVMLDILLPILTIANSYALVTAYRYAIESRQRQSMVQLFTNHLSPELVPDALTAVQRGQLQLTGQAQTATVLAIQFQSDPEYTLIEEPEKIMAHFQSHLRTVQDIIFSQHGTIVTANNQQLLAIFNAPILQTDHVKRAFQTVQYIKDNAELNSNANLQMKYGLTTGRIIVGYSNGQLTAVGKTIHTVLDLVAQAQPNQLVFTNSVQQLPN